MQFQLPPQFLPTSESPPNYKSGGAAESHLYDSLMIKTMRNRHTRTRSSQSRRTSGFTLLELLLVLAILVVIGGIVTVNVVGTLSDANADTTRIQLNDLKNRITTYQIRMNSLPQTLEELRDGPSDAAKKAKWGAPIITEIPTDAWEQPIVYTVEGNTYELRSGGVDGQPSTDDDIIVEGM